VSTIKDILVFRRKINLVNGGVKMFIENHILEGIITRPNIVEINEETIRRILLNAGIKSAIKHISKPHPWIMQSQRIHLEDGTGLLLKVPINSSWTDDTSILNQVKASSIIASTGIPQPQILSYSTNVDEYGFMFILSEGHKGKYLHEIYNRVTQHDRTQLYCLLGETYSNLHSFKKDWAGIWNGDPNVRKYPIHPSEFYRNAEIYSGSNRYLLDKKIINYNQYKRICTIWDDNLTYLKQRPSSLVHVSPFPWSIKIHHENNRFSISGLTALADFMWWDAMSDVAHLLYPPFLDITKEEENAFKKGYKYSLDEKSLKLYLILNRLCAMAGCYLAPVKSVKASIWINNEVKRIETILDSFH